MSRIQKLISVGILATCLGCNATAPPDQAVDPPPEAAQYLLATAPEEPQSVKEAKASAADGEDVTLIGRIGGSDSPFVSGRAMFTLVDTSLVPCNERDGDSCRTPWDYCCDTDQLPKSTAVVKVVDAEGKTVPVDAKGILGLKELQTIVVQGKAQRDAAGNLIVLAPAVHVKK
jgi:hypothetical protein